MRVLVACEYSAIVRDTFRAKGCDAWSCNLLPTEGDPHISKDHAQNFVRIESDPKNDCKLIVYYYSEQIILSPGESTVLSPRNDQ